MSFFSYFIPNIFTSKIDTTHEDEQIKEMEKIKEQRFRLLPFAWKSKIACDTKEVLESNLEKTKNLSKKCETFHDSAKTYQQLTRQLSDKYKK